MKNATKVLAHEKRVVEVQRRFKCELATIMLREKDMKIQSPSEMFGRYEKKYNRENILNLSATAELYYRCNLPTRYFHRENTSLVRDVNFTRGIGKGISRRKIGHIAKYDVSDSHCTL